MKSSEITTDPGGPAQLHPDTIPAALFQLGPDGTVSFMNAEARGLPQADDFLGRTWLELWPGVAEQEWQALLESGKPLRHDGEIEDRALAFTLVRDAAAGVVLAYGSDVSELKHAQQVLVAQAAELRENAAFPEMNPGPVCRLDLDGTVLRANRAALSVFGQELIGRRWRDLLPAVSASVWRQIVEDGVRIWNEADIGETCFGFTMARAPGSQFVYVYGADVSALKEAEKTVREMAVFPEMNPGPVLRLDSEGTVLLANLAARELFPDTDLLGKRWIEICPSIPGGLLDEVKAGGETVGYEVAVAHRHMLFTHAPNHSGEQVFVYGTDLTELKEAERALSQSERMATLGTLAAGVAHELNNPAAAVQRAAAHLGNTLGQLQSAQLQLNTTSLDLSIQELLATLDERARERAAAPPEFDPLTRSDNEQDVELWLEDQGIEESWDLAPALVALGYLPPTLDELAHRLPSDQLAPVITWMSRTYPAYAVLEEIHHGSGRISQIVTALKAYSYLDRASLQAVDVNESLGHTLIILQHKLKQGMKVDLELDPELPTIEAYGGELNQVWTNLIDNAVDAVEGKGRLLIRTANENGWIRAEFEDDGPGIPEEIQGRIFDPFFTTKEPGRGTGLGLNTTFTIVVKKHGGRIDLESRPGQTRFIVRLPRVRKAATGLQAGSGRKAT